MGLSAFLRQDMYDPNRWSCSAIGCTNRDTKESKDKTYKVLSNTGENRREDYV